jgi:DNA repair protein RecO
MGILRQVGYRPELGSCVICQSLIEPVTNGFSLEGGVVCANCLTMRPDVLPISVNALKILRAIDRGDIERILALRVPPDVWRELSNLLTRYITRIHGRELSAQRVMSELRLE